MDGLEGRLNASVRVRLSAALSVAILSVAVLAGGFSFWSAFDEAHELQDDVLRQLAALVVKHPPDAMATFGGHLSTDTDEEQRIIVQRLGDHTTGSLAVDEGGILPLPTTLPDGVQTLHVGGESFRVLVRTLPLGERIAISQETGFRNDIARLSALRTVLPFLLVVPILLVIVARLVDRMFRPIGRLASEIDARSEQELHPVPPGQVPDEVRPFVVAINRLLGRVETAMQTQQRFLADAAHELRSPLTALSLQAERLGQTDLPMPAVERLNALRQGIARSRNLLDQLLALARAQSSAGAPPHKPAPVSVLHVYRQVLEQLMPQAEVSQIDIGIEGDEDAAVAVSELDLTTLVRNLADNAIRYTPPGGQVDLSVRRQGDTAVLTVQDNGPGIPEEERTRVFDPFYRVLGTEQVGSGLGLSIVRSIADRYGARILLAYTDEARRRGLQVSVSIPVVGASDVAGRD